MALTVEVDTAIEARTVTASVADKDTVSYHGSRSVEAMGVDRVCLQLPVRHCVCAALLGIVQTVPEHHQDCCIHACAR